MFEGLDDIDWASLEHAYGSASDVPGLIRDLDGDQAAFDRAISTFWGNIYHQGTVYPATVAAVPFLLSALDRTVRTERQTELLELLREMAVGHGYYDVHQHLSLMQTIIKEKDPADFQETLSTEASTVQQVTQAVFTGWAQIEALLQSQDESVRLAALGLLTNLAICDASNPARPDEPARYLGVRPEGSEHGEWAARLINLIQTASIETLTPLERASQLEVLRQLSRLDHPLLSLDRLNNVPALEQLMIIKAAAYAALQDAPTLPLHFSDLLIDLFQHRAEIIRQTGDDRWPWGTNFLEDTLDMACCLTPDGVDRLGETMAGLIREFDGFDDRGGQVFYLILGADPPNILEDPCDLRPGQRAIAEAFLAETTPDKIFDFWSKTNGNASLICKEHGVPHDRNAWLKWLGLPLAPVKDEPTKPSKTKLSWLDKLRGN